jgi:hypothetical protein
VAFRSSRMCWARSFAGSSRDVRFVRPRSLWAHVHGRQRVAWNAALHIRGQRSTQPPCAGLIHSFPRRPTPRRSTANARTERCSLLGRSRPDSSGVQDGLLLRRAERERRPADRVVTEREAQLARRAKALRAVRSIRDTGLVEAQRAEVVAPEEARLTRDRLRLGPRRCHDRDPNTFGPCRATPTFANRNNFVTRVRKWRGNTRRGCKPDGFAPRRKQRSRILR